MSPRKTTLALAGALLVLIVFPALSGADASQPPDVTVSAPDLTNTTAVLHGTVNPQDPTNGASYTFSWGTTSAYGNDDSGTTAAGTSPIDVSDSLSSLTPQTTYHYRLCATNTPNPPGGTSCTGDQTFTTLPNTPTVTTGSATNDLASKSATLGGSVNPNGDSTTYQFVYGTASAGDCSGYSSAGTSKPAGSGTSPVSASDTISSLAANTTYYFRLKATNGGGTTCGGESSFTTPNVATSSASAATNVTTSGAKLNGSVTPNGSNVTSVVFRYGTSCSGPGWSSGCSSISATPSSIAGNASATSVSATLSGLGTGQTFHYTVCATNAYGTSCDANDHTVTTNTPPTAGLTADKTSGPAPLTVNFTLSGSDTNGGSIVSWTLTFGDGTSTSGTGAPSGTVPHQYATTGSRTATLTVTDDQGATGTSSQNIQVNTNQPPNVTFGATPTTGTVPLDVQFNGSASDPDGSLKSLKLDFGDGSAVVDSPAFPVTHTYSSAGTFTAKLTATDSSDASVTKTVSITVNPQPTISINDASGTEGSTINFSVTLSAPSTHDISFQVDTSTGTATEGTDFNGVHGVQTIPAGTACPGAQACQISVSTIDDSLYEGNETFTVTLSSAVGATFLDATGTGTINDNDTPPILMIDNTATNEGNAGSVAPTTQSWVQGGNLTVADASGFAAGIPFYVSTPGSTRSLAGLAGPFTFSGITGNTLHNVSPAGSVTSGDHAFQPWTMTWTVYVCDAAKTPGIDTSQCAHTTSGAPITVNYYTSDGTSSVLHTPVRKGQDYVAQCSVVVLSPATDRCDGPVSPPITIPAGQQSAQVSVPVIGNTTPDDYLRTFFLRLKTPTGATIRWDLGTGTIIDDDHNPPTAATGDASAITTTGATVPVTVNPKQQATSVYVEYGTNTDYKTHSAVQTLTGASADNTDHALTFTVSGLQQGTTYYYRAVALHDIGTNPDHGGGYGVDKILTTASAPPPAPPPPPAACSVTTKDAVGITSTSATVHGLVLAPQGGTVWVEYGTSTNYPFATEPLAVQASPAIQAFEVPLDNLNPRTFYHYRFVAQCGSQGPAGDDATFTTNRAPRPMLVNLTTGKVDARRDHRVPLTFTCTGQALKHCVVTVEIDDQKGRVVSRGKYTLDPGAKRWVRLMTLNTRTWPQLRTKSRLALDVNWTYRDTPESANGDGKTITVYYPGVRHAPAAKPGGRR